MLFTFNLGGEISTEFICYGLLVNEGIGAALWGLCESELSDMLNKGGRRTAAPQCYR